MSFGGVIVKRCVEKDSFESECGEIVIFIILFVIWKRIVNKSFCRLELV